MFRHSTLSKYFIWVNTLNQFKPNYKQTIKLFIKTPTKNYKEKPWKDFKQKEQNAGKRILKW